MRKKIESVLLELGITPELVGFDYIRRAVEIILESDVRLKITSGIYEKIAKDFGTTGNRVERNIRHAFSKMDTNGEAFFKYFNSDKLTNSALLYTLAYKLKEDE